MCRNLGVLDLEDVDVIDSIDLKQLKSFLNRKTNLEPTNIINLHSKTFKLIRINVFIGGNYKTFFGIKEEGIKGMHEFTDFLYENFGKDDVRICLANKAANTIRNYARPLIKFLNYIYSCSEIKSIECLDKDIIKGFINSYAYNLLPNDNKYDGSRSKTEVAKANGVITKFVFWLYTSKKSARSKSKRYNMKYFSDDDFAVKHYSRKLKSGGVEHRAALRDIVTVNLDNTTSKKRRKAVNASFYSVKKLIEISRVMEPMITFAIVLDAFAGLRTGEAMQMHNGRLNLIDSRFESCSLYIDLTSDAKLRSDGVKTGEIKINREQPVFELFADIIREEYKEHQKILEKEGFLMHMYGALFINSDGKAMTSDNYMRRFKEVAEQAIINIKIEAEKGVQLAIREERLLEGQMITPHSLRYVYSQFIKDAVGQRAVVAYYRGDGSLKSQDTYVPNTDLKKAKELFMSKYVNV